jgi:hypothetical protein
VNESTPVEIKRFQITSYILAQELCPKCAERSQALFETPEAQQRIGSQDIVTRDESGIYLDVSPNSIWIGVEAKVPTRPPITKSSTEAMLLMFSDIHGMTPGNQLLEDASFNGPISMKKFSSL